MEVLYHLLPYLWPYVVGIVPYIGLKNRPLIHGYGHGYGLRPWDVDQSMDHVRQILDALQAVNDKR